MRRVTESALSPGKSGNPDSRREEGHSMGVCCLICDWYGLVRELERGEDLLDECPVCRSTELADTNITRQRIRCIDCHWAGVVAELSRGLDGEDRCPNCDSLLWL
jgi:hypothetical protein